MRATHRLQLEPRFGFREAREVVPLLRDIGVTHLYLSPVLQARRGSTHGYDVCDPRVVSEDLGGEDELRRLCDAGLRVIVDVVPNHMAACDENPFWTDPALRERFFDIDPATGRARRFFDVDELAGVRVEDPEVFAVTHGKILQLVRDGLIDGVRVDHPDGLADPAGYLRRLRESGVAHVWVEKILSPGEPLRDWPVEGTTGYEFMNDAIALFVDPASGAEITGLHHEMTGDGAGFEEVAAASKRQLAATTFAPEVERLRALHDHPRIAEALASLPVYRTYVEPWSGTVDDEDRRVIGAAAMDEDLKRILLLEEPGHDEFVTRFQQTTGAVTAKGVEDTALYRYTRLLALNEVGGDPARFGIEVDAMHAANAQRAERFPRALLALQTHDTKRGPDVRARLAALTWLPDRWTARVRAWRDRNAIYREGEAPDGSEELLVYQTLVGAWPIDAERMRAYMEKALREEKTRTAWVDGDPEWEGQVFRFCDALLADVAFTGDVTAFVSEIEPLADRIALGQLLLSLTAPGVPDLYNGETVPRRALVDPDNRRPVDFALRRVLLDEVRSGAPVRYETAQLHMIVNALDVRERHEGAFAAGYEPLDAGDDVLAYARGGRVIVVIPVRRETIPRLAVPEHLRGEWRDALGDGAVIGLGEERVTLPPSPALLERT